MTVNEFEYSPTDQFPVSRRSSDEIVQLKDFPHRASLRPSVELPEVTSVRRHGSDTVRQRALRSQSQQQHGHSASVHSQLSPAESKRSPSIRKKKRFMMSKTEVKRKFFYPVNAPKRELSRRGKYRTRYELNSCFNYMNIDVGMSKELCINQYVRSYYIRDGDLIKPNPQLHEEVKSITVDSNNRVILYTPAPTDRNSSVADAEQILNEQLQKLGDTSALAKTSPLSRSSHMKTFATFPPTRKPNFALRRTNSLPVRIKNNRLETLWNLYLRRAIARRIKWRLEHMGQSSSDFTSKSYKLSRETSVETSFFMSHVLHEDGNESKEETTSTQDHQSPNQRDNKHDGSQESVLSSPRSPTSPRRDEMMDSLERLIKEVESIISTVGQ